MAYNLRETDRRQINQGFRIDVSEAENNSFQVNPHFLHVLEPEDWYINSSADRNIPAHLANQSSDIGTDIDDASEIDNSEIENPVGSEAYSSSDIDNDTFTNNEEAEEANDEFLGGRNPINNEEIFQEYPSQGSANTTDHFRRVADFLQQRYNLDCGLDFGFNRSHISIREPDDPNEHIMATIMAENEDNSILSEEQNASIITGNDEENQGYEIFDNTGLSPPQQSNNSDEPLLLDDKGSDFIRINMIRTDASKSRIERAEDRSFLEMFRLNTGDARISTRGESLLPQNLKKFRNFREWRRKYHD